MLYYITMLLLIAVDRITKYLAVQKLYGNPSVEVVSGLLNFTYVENTGVAFGMFRGMNYIFIPLGIAASVLCLVYMHRCVKKGRRLLGFSVAMIASGALGNIADKLMYGYVVDFIDVSFISFPVFNFADICITVGAVITACCIIFEKDSAKTEENDV